MLLNYGDIDKKFQPFIFEIVKSFVISKLLFKKQGRCDKRTYRKMYGCYNYKVVVQHPPTPNDVLPLPLLC